MTDPFARRAVGRAVTLNRSRLAQERILNDMFSRCYAPASCIRHVFLLGYKKSNLILPIRILRGGRLLSNACNLEHETVIDYTVGI